MVRAGGVYGLVFRAVIDSGVQFGLKPGIFRFANTLRIAHFAIGHIVSGYYRVLACAWAVHNYWGLLGA